MSPSLALLLFLAGWGASASDGRGTPHYDAATCRAACVRECWLNCSPLRSDWSLWSAVCSSRTQCTGVCRLVCQPSAALLEVSEPFNKSVAGLRLFVNRRLRSQGSVRRYLRLYWAGPSNHNRMWPAYRQKEVSGVDGSPPSSPLESSVVVVDPGGLEVGLSSGSIASSNINITFADIRDVKDNDGWSVTVASMTRQGALVFADLSWRPPEDDLWAARRGGGSPLYMVTWEVDGGGITGNMLTDSASVTLSLWADTVFHVQVELSRRSVTLSRSGRLRLDTADHKGARSKDNAKDTEQSCGLIKCCECELWISICGFIIGLIVFLKWGVYCVDPEETAAQAVGSAHPLTPQRPELPKRSPPPATGAECPVRSLSTHQVAGKPVTQPTSS